MIRPSVYLFRTVFRLISIAAVVFLASCRSSEKPAINPLPSPPPGAYPAQIAGRYAGSYTYGRSFAERAGQTVGFVLTLHQAPASSQVTGTLRENSGFGGAATADVSGTCVSEGDVIHLRFTKKHRRSKQPVENYLGSLPPGSRLLTGIWFDAETSADSGTFQLDLTSGY